MMMTSVPSRRWIVMRSIMLRKSQCINFFGVISNLQYSNSYMFDNTYYTYVDILTLDSYFIFYYRFFYGNITYQCQFSIYKSREYEYEKYIRKYQINPSSSGTKGEDEASNTFLKTNFEQKGLKSTVFPGDIDT